MSLSRTVSKINGDFGRKSQIFPLLVFNAPLKGLQLELGSKTSMVGLPDQIFLGRFNRLDTKPACDWRTDGQTDRR